MCGICGILNHDRTNHVGQGQLFEMTQPSLHRGPDDQGFFSFEHVGFGFNRLSIIDLHNGHQPMSNEDGTVWIAFNGEIYNFQSLRKELQARGHIFRTHTDTETIVHLYEDYGEDCVKKLRGMFAFAIYDQKKQKLFCARDRFGIKPFFYHTDHKRFLFGSEIKNILAVMDDMPELNFDALDYYMAFGYTPSNQSIYNSIKKLPPAHTLTLSAGKEPLIKKYWDVCFEPDYSIQEAEWEARIIEKLKEAIKIRMISDVPLGAFLSGGIDSSAVVALMSELMDQPVKTFSIGFHEKEFNELPKARIIADRYQTDHHEHIVESQSIDILPKLINAYDEPFADSSAIPTYFVCEFARRHVTVALSGDGGDELFAGYDHYQKLNRVQNFHNITAGLFISPLRLLHSIIPTKVKGSGITYYMSRPRNSFAAYFGKMQETERAQIYRPEHWQNLKTRGESIKKAILAATDGNEFISRIQEVDMHTWLVDDILTKVDRASMSNSLEVRVPILDHEFAELTFKIPHQFKLKGSSGKHIFKQALRPYLPKELLFQKKKGFGVPLKQWFKNDLKQYLQDQLMDPGNSIYQYLNYNYIKKLVHDHETGMRDLNHKIWTIVFLNEWLCQTKKGVLENA